MKNSLLILPFLLLGCTSNAQKTNMKPNNPKRDVVIKDGKLMSLEGIDVSKYELSVEDFDVEKVTKHHLLCLATDECDEALVAQLLEKGADVNFSCEEGDHVITNLAFCMENGVELTKLLLSKGANINGADQDNESFLSYTISYNNLKLAAFLIDWGADRRHRDTNRNMGCLPVHGIKSVEMLKLLMAKGFDINQRCDNGRNLLHFAAKDNLPKLAQYLIENRLVDINQKDIDGKTPLDYATIYKHPEIAALLKKRK